MDGSKAGRIDRFNSAGLRMPAMTRSESRLASDLARVASSAGAARCSSGRSPRRNLRRIRSSMVGTGRLRLNLASVQNNTQPNLRARGASSTSQPCIIQRPSTPPAQQRGSAPASAGVRFPKRGALHARLTSHQNSEPRQKEGLLRTGARATGPMFDGDRQHARGCAPKASVTWQSCADSWEPTLWVLFGRKRWRRVAGRKC